MHAMGRDDLYPLRMSEVGCRGNRPRTALLDSTPDDGRRKRPKYVE